ncbi:ABC transporter ATP-binding protein [Paenibacillus sp. y28]|uniref:ABC transporter ATP-binding protein n=1 Tax=Paenibacillus sp. y28 TaxID=3129110 RepID=UPI0030186700
MLLKERRNEQQTAAPIADRDSGRSTPAGPRLEGEHLAYRHGSREPWLFQGINIGIGAGEIVGLAGPSGCGKTSLGRLLAGYARPGEGRVLLDGLPLSGRGYCPVQLVYQHPEKAVNPRWRMRRILAESGTPDGSLLERLGIEARWLNRWPGELSGGELQRFCVARALGPQTRFLIADEMTTMLDAMTQAQIWHTVLEEARTRGMGILVISHDRHLMNRLCDRIVEWNALTGKQAAQMLGR